MKSIIDIFLQWLIFHGIRILAIVIGAFIVVQILRLVIRKFRNKLIPPGKLESERAKRTETLVRITENVARVVIFSAAVLMCMKEFGIDIAPLLAGVGIVGLAVGFGAQSLVKDVINGFFILLENRMSVRDVVEIAGKSGLVESIGLRVTVLRDLEGKVHVVPNGEISTLTNMTKEWSRAVLEIGVAYKEDVDNVIEILNEVGEELRKDKDFGPLLLEPMEVLGIESFGDSSVNIKLMFKTKPIMQWKVAREFRLRVKRAFDEKKIEIPFPHRTLYVGEGDSTGRLKIGITKDTE
ncbi:MAG: mechanosensitive ion channel family protein [Candidatus Krumholzibacteriota bacterium]|nr:mechanosensitive ion channel family protein [Candidatus Krumholzibacteriota bacterium]